MIKTDGLHKILPQNGGFATKSQHSRLRGLRVKFRLCALCVLCVRFRLCALCVLSVRFGLRALRGLRVRFIRGGAPRDGVHGAEERVAERGTEGVEEDVFDLGDARAEGPLQGFDEQGAEEAERDDRAAQGRQRGKAEAERYEAPGGRWRGMPGQDLRTPRTAMRPSGKIRNRKGSLKGLRGQGDV